MWYYFKCKFGPNIAPDLNTVVCRVDNDILPGAPSPGKLIIG